MNPIDILRGLNTPKDWATFMLGFVAGVALTAAGIVGLKNVFNLDLLAKGSYYTADQVNSSFVSNQAVAQSYMKKEDVETNYIHKSEVGRNYLSLSDVQEKYILKNPDSQNVGPEPVNMKKYMLRSDLANYISKDDMQRSYELKVSCEQRVLNRRRINENHTMRAGDKLDLPAAGITLQAHEGFYNGFGDVPAYISVFHAGASDPSDYNSSHFERYEYNSRRITFRIQKVSKGVFQASLTEDK